MTSSSRQIWVLLQCQTVRLHISPKCISILINKKHQKILKSDFKCMRFLRIVNLHRLRNKFNFRDVDLKSCPPHSPTASREIHLFIQSCCTCTYEDIFERSRLMTLTIIYDWNIKINMSLIKSDGSLYQRQFVRRSKKVKRDLSYFLLFLLSLSGVLSSIKSNLTWSEFHSTLNRFKDESLFIIPTIHVDGKCRTLAPFKVLIIKRFRCLSRTSFFDQFQRNWSRDFNLAAFFFITLSSQWMGENNFHKVFINIGM